MRAMVPQDFWRMKQIGDSQLSPDGTQVAYSLHQLDPDKDREVSEIWVAPVAGGEGRRLTSGGDAETTPRWSPVDRRIAYLSAGRLFITEPSGRTAAMPVSSSLHVVEQFTWSPLGQQICFAARGRSKWPEQQANALVYDTLNLKHVNLPQSPTVPGAVDSWFDGRFHHLWLVDVATGEVRQLTDEAAEDFDPAFSPDGKWIAFVSTRTPNAAGESCRAIWLMSAAGDSEPRLLTDCRYMCAKPSFSPDGRMIAYFGHHDHPGNQGKNLHVWVQDLHDGSAVDILEHWDRTARDLVMSTSRFPGPYSALPPPIWSPDGATIYFIGSDRGASNVYSVPTKGGLPVLVTSGDHAVHNVSFDQDRQRYAALITSTIDPGDIHVGDVVSQNTHRITDTNADLMSTVHAPPHERITFEGAAGAIVEAFLAKPNDFRPDSKYPLIIRMIAGPHLAFGATYSADIHMLTGRGYAVLSCNQHGATSYGEDFCLSIVNDWCGKDAEDILAAARHMVGTGYIDGARIGVDGFSYSGLLVNWLVTRTNVFAVAASWMSISNMISFFGTSDREGDFLQYSFGNRDPYNDPEAYIAKSPLTRVKHVQTPLLLLQGELDFRTPVGQAEEFYTALKMLGKETRLVVYPGEGHFMRWSGRPSSRVHHMATILEWFDSHLHPAGEMLTAPV